LPIPDYVRQSRAASREDPETDRFWLDRSLRSERLGDPRASSRVHQLLRAGAGRREGKEQQRSKERERERERGGETTRRKETELEYDSINPAIERVGEASVPVDESQRGGNDEEGERRGGGGGEDVGQAMTMTVRFRASQSRSTNCQVKAPKVPLSEPPRA